MNEPQAVGATAAEVFATISQLMYSPDSPRAMSVAEDKIAQI